MLNEIIALIIWYYDYIWKNISLIAFCTWFKVNIQIRAFFDSKNFLINSLILCVVRANYS